MNRAAISTGLNFGLTSGVITTLGLIVGLHAGTNSMQAVVGGILTIAIADSMSDALGIHISKESEVSASKNEVWIATLVTFLTKMGMSLSFLVPILLLDLNKAITVSVAWGLTVIAALSYYLSRKSGESSLSVVGEHLTIAVAVIFATHYVGDWVAIRFG
ncbi:MAG: hypothetical protein OEZ43_05565 [Gammaproteobacteria bacterium]|nr:hypothetical protein [Gammaproteobacteria bacterium]